MSVGPNEQKLLFEVRRKLGSMGVESQFTARGDALKGSVAFRDAQIVPNPLGGTPVDRITFTVWGDGVMRVDQPEPASGLQLLDPLQLESLEALSEWLRGAVDARAAKLRGQALRLSTLGLEYELDAERLALTARMDLGHLGIVELDSIGERVIARELVDGSGEKRKSFGDLEIDLEGFEDRVDLEIFVSSHAEKLAPDRAGQSIVSGHLAHDPYATPDLESDHEASALVAGLLPPVAGEVWVMDVRVESDDGEEVRYLGVNIAGDAYGAPRVLPKIAFETAYTAVTQGYRMLVQVASVGDDDVCYVKLDTNRRPIGPERSVSIVGFLANFIPEAGAY